MAVWLTPATQRSDRIIQFVRRHERVSSAATAVARNTYRHRESGSGGDGALVIRLSTSVDFIVPTK